jgi:16S rRNA (guanine527-N7)-methyltransferase
MTETEAQDWLVQELAVSRETLEKLDLYRQMVIAESAHQNLIARSTFDVFWLRHIVDSAQLVPLAAEAGEGLWLDLGSGAGMPAIIVALLCDREVHMVEERRGRIGFLNRVIEALGIDNAQVHGCKVETLHCPPAAVISARAFAPLPKLLKLAHSFSTQKTLWLLPKGRSARDELENVKQDWQGAFHVKQSITDAEAAILIGSGVRKVGKK